MIIICNCIFHPDADILVSVKSGRKVLLFFVNLNYNVNYYIPVCFMRWSLYEWNNRLASASGSSTDLSVAGSHCRDG